MSKAIPLRDMETDEVIREEDLPFAPGIDEVLIAEEDQARVSAVVDALPADLKDIYELWATGEYSYAEMAAEFEVPIGTIRARVKRLQRHMTSALHTEVSP